MHRKALDVRRSLASEPSADSEIRADLARSLVDIAILLEKMDRTNEAPAAFDEARTVLSRLMAADARAEAIQRELAPLEYWSAVACFRTGKALIRANRAAEAARTLRRSIALRNALSFVENDDQFDQGRSHALLASLAGTCESGVSAESARSEADEVMKWLRQTVDGGFKGVEDLKTDPDFRGLRERDDFLELIQDMTMPDDPFVPAS